MDIPGPKTVQEASRFFISEFKRHEALFMAGALAPVIVDYEKVAAMLNNTTTSIITTKETTKPYFTTTLQKNKNTTVIRTVITNNTSAYNISKQSLF